MQPTINLFNPSSSDAQSAPSSSSNVIGAGGGFVRASTSFKSSSTFAPMLARQASGVLYNAHSADLGVGDDDIDEYGNAKRKLPIASAEEAQDLRTKDLVDAAVLAHRALREKWVSALEEHLWGSHGGMEGRLQQSAATTAALHHQYHNKNSGGTSEIDVVAMIRNGYQWRKDFDSKCPGDPIPDMAASNIIAPMCDAGTSLSSLLVASSSSAASPPSSFEDIAKRLRLSSDSDASSLRGERRLPLLADNIVQAIANDFADVERSSSSSSKQPPSLRSYQYGDRGDTNNDDAVRGSDGMWSQMPAGQYHGLLQSVRVSTTFMTPDTIPARQPIHQAAMEGAGRAGMDPEVMTKMYPTVKIQHLDVDEMLDSNKTIRKAASGIVTTQQGGDTGISGEDISRQTSTLTLHSTNTNGTASGSSVPHKLFSNDLPSNPAKALRQLCAVSSGCHPAHNGASLVDAITSGRRGTANNINQGSGSNSNGAMMMSLTTSEDEVPSSDTTQSQLQMALGDKCRYYHYGPSVGEFPSTRGGGAGAQNAASKGYVSAGDWMGQQRDTPVTNATEEAQTNPTGRQQGSGIRSARVLPHNIIDMETYGHYIEAFHTAFATLDNIHQNAKCAASVRDAPAGYFSLATASSSGESTRSSTTNGLAPSPPTLPVPVDHTLGLYCQGHEVHGNFSAYFFVEGGDLCAIVSSDSKGFQHEISSQLAAVGFAYSGYTPPPPLPTTDAGEGSNSGSGYGLATSAVVVAPSEREEEATSVDWLEGALFLQNNTTHETGFPALTIQPVDALLDVLLNLNIKVSVGTNAPDAVSRGGPKGIGGPGASTTAPQQYVPRACMSIIATYPFSRGSLRQIPIRVLSTTPMMIPTTHITTTHPTTSSLPSYMVATSAGAKRHRGDEYEEDEGSTTSSSSSQQRQVIVATGLVPYTKCTFTFGGAETLIPPRCLHGILDILTNTLQLQQYTAQLSVGPVHDSILSELGNAGDMASRRAGGGGRGRGMGGGSGSGIQAIGARAANRGGGSKSLDSLLSLGHSWRLFSSRLASPFWVSVGALRRQGIPLSNADDNDGTTVRFRLGVQFYFKLGVQS